MSWMMRCPHCGADSEMKSEALGQVQAGQLELARVHCPRCGGEIDLLPLLLPVPSPGSREAPHPTRARPGQWLVEGWGGEGWSIVGFDTAQAAAEAYAEAPEDFGDQPFDERGEDDGSAQAPQEISILEAVAVSEAAIRGRADVEWVIERLVDGWPECFTDMDGSALPELTAKRFEQDLDSAMDAALRTVLVRHGIWPMVTTGKRRTFLRYPEGRVEEIFPRAAVAAP